MDLCSFQALPGSVVAPKVRAAAAASAEPHAPALL